jgi:hypothetical protein
MGEGAFWFLVFPALAAAALVWLALLVIGVGVIRAALRSAFSPSAAAGRIAPDAQPPTLKAFIETTMMRARRS